MNTHEFYKKQYWHTFTDFPDEIMLKKTVNSDWIELSMDVHDTRDASISLRSKEMAEGLHFMLGQLLGK